MPRTAIVFASVTLLAPPLLAAAALWGGAWVVVAAAYLSLFAFLADELTRLALPATPDASEFPAAPWLSAALGLAHLALLPLGLAAIVGSTGHGPLEMAGTALAFGLFFGQVSMANAHELIHRPARHLRALGVLLYTTLLFGHHASAHRLVHHVHAATPRDPNTARLGESYYAFAVRAWFGSFRAGLAAERRRRGGVPWWRTPYAIYLGGAAACLGLALAAGGWPTLGALAGLAFYAQAQLLMSDYVQHYGLERALRPDGSREPMGLAHSWNARHWFTAAMTLNAPRHSDHHVNPSRAFPALELPAPETAPRLPRSLPAMATLALVPSLWRRSMDARALRWHHDLQAVPEPLHAGRAPAAAGG
jgi:alkane 1-monooxygenase